MLSKPNKPKVPYFTPDKRQCLILGNFDYSAIRWGEKKDAAGNVIVDEAGNLKQYGFADLLHVKNDIKIFRKRIEEYGFPSTDISKQTNLSVDAAKKTIL